MFVEPGIQVKTVIDTAPAQANRWHIQLIEQGDTDAEIDRRLFLGQTPHRGQRQVDDFHFFLCFFFLETT